MKHINLIKLCVGVESVEHLIEWRRGHPSPLPDGESRHTTRMWPKREPELLNGGSLFWVIKGVILCRQRILRLDRVEGKDGILRCGIIMDPKIIRTEAAPRRPFQGWRYLAAEDAPRDLRKSRKSESTLPVELSQALADIGVR